MPRHAFILSLAWLATAVHVGMELGPVLAASMVAIWLAGMLIARSDWFARVRQAKRERRIFNLVGGGMSVEVDLNLPVDEQTLITVGEAFAATLGTDPIDMVGKRWLDFVHPDDRDPALAEAYSLPAGKNLTAFTMRWRHAEALPSGEPQYVWLEWHAFPDLSARKAFAFARDMTLQIQKEEQSKTWARLTSELMGVADARVPMGERSFQWVNPAWTRQLGWSKTELTSMRITDLLHPSDGPEVLARCLRREQEGSMGEILSRTRIKVKTAPDEPDEYHWYEWTTIREGSWVYTSGRDIEFEQRHQAEMARAISDLESRNADLERFASVAAHQLRSPPRTIAGIAQALEEDYGDRLDSEGFQFLRDIREDADLMAEIVDGLYRFSRVRTADELTVTPVDLNKVVGFIREKRTRKACSKAAQGEKEDAVFFGILPVVLGDQLLLKEVFANLIDNALKFNESDPKEVHISAEIASDGRWYIQVRDNGIGIDPQYQPKLFTMFQRVHTGYPGTGIGLALVAAIVAKHGGEVTVQSIPGEGSTFTLDLEPAWIA